MKTLLTKIGLSILIYLLDNETVHKAIRDAAKRTSNEFDDAGAEALVKLIKDIALLLGKK